MVAAVRSANRERVVAEPDGGKHDAEQEPGQPERKDAEQCHDDIGDHGQNEDDDGVDDEGERALADHAGEELRLRHGIVSVRLVGEISPGSRRKSALLAHLVSHWAKGCKPGQSTQTTW